MTRALIVDDHEENLYYLRALLTAHGWEVESARHGAEALVKARQAPPDLVISDLLMPVMDGYTLLRNWKEDARLRGAPFIVYTATYTTPADEQLALNLGADAFILKPAEPEAFMARVRAVQAAAASGKKTNPPGDDEKGLLRDYSETLIRKLEQKTWQLEESNRLLQEDIAARKLTEAALRESEERFRQLAESVDDVFWLSSGVSPEILYVSPAYEAVWGRSRESLMASPGDWIEAVHPDDRQRVAGSLGQYISGGWDQTFRIIWPDGRLRWIRARAFPVPDDNGAIYRVAGISRDITEYRRLEEELRQAQKLEAVGRLAGGVAHDFNNLLSVILSYAGLALETLEPGDAVRDDIEEVRRAGERATELTRQLLAFSRRQMLQPQVLDLSQVLLDAENMLRLLLGEGIELSMRVTRPSGRVAADRSQIEQIIVNLVVNARDAMPEGGLLIVETSTLERGGSFALAHPELAPGPYVRLAVTDSGLGMDAATREHIFEPFFTTKETGKGTGLGLSTVFGIVKQSRGHIEVHSTSGSGSTFEVYLPCTDRALPVTSIAPPPPPTLRGSETVLLVEDDEQVRGMSRTVLGRSGYRVIEARSGDEALRLSEQHDGDIQLLLTDVVMPRMTGRELAERLAPSRPHMKVLYVSGYTADTLVLETPIAFLQKPITPDALLRKVREVLASPTAP